jgi:hypothetical protein
VGPRAGVDDVKQRKIYLLCQDSNPGRSTTSPSLYRLSYPGFLSYCKRKSLLSFDWSPSDGFELFKFCFQVKERSMIAQVDH